MNEDGTSQVAEGADGALFIDAGSSHPGTGGDCTPQVIGLLRDVQAGSICPYHRDFQNETWFTQNTAIPDLGFPERGIVQPTLGADQKPVHSGGSFITVTSPATFDAWYRDDPTCNQTFQYEIVFDEDPRTGNAVFDSTDHFQNGFFPLDGIGYGNSGADQFGVQHNFHFTFELHMTFHYTGGEIFRFSGDDDLWVFINNQLAIDLGGVHAAEEAEVSLDASAAQLGIEVGGVYAIDFFHAERQTEQSNFRIETSLVFVNCDPIFIY